MAQQPQPDPTPPPIPDDEKPPHPIEPLQIDTPVIHMQDLERNPSPESRVSNAGVKVKPPREEDEAAIEAIQEFEEQLRKQVPG